MKLLLTSIVASLCAIMVQPAVLFFWLILPDIFSGGGVPWHSLGPIFFYSILFATPFVLLLGLPLSLILWRIGQFKWWILVIAGVLSAIAFIGWDLPGGNSSYSSGGSWNGRHVEFVVAGAPTLYGWLDYVRSIAIFALHGFVGATVYYLVWVSVLRPNNSFKPTPLRGVAWFRRWAA